MAQYKVAYPYVAAIKTEPEAAEATYEKGLALGKMIDVEVTPNYNEASLYMSKEVKVEKGYYYRLRGYHSCTKSGVTENGGSVTDGIYIG